MDPKQGWHSIDAQEYPYVFGLVEFIYPTQNTPSWFGKWIDIAPYSDVAGLWWRGVPVNWPTVPRPAS